MQGRFMQSLMRKWLLFTLISIVRPVQAGGGGVRLASYSIRLLQGWWLQNRSHSRPLPGQSYVGAKTAVSWSLGARGMLRAYAALPMLRAMLPSHAHGLHVFRVGYTALMDVYDFDGTLYSGDSTADFVKHCLRRYPRIATTLPRTGVAAAACFGLHALSKTSFKQSLYRFLPLVPDIEREVSRFWALNEQRIAGPCHPSPGDLIISASPEFLLHDVCAKRGLVLIASQVDPHTGCVLGPNCSNEEKITRFRELYPSAEVERFYSDSRNDDPMAGLAREAYLVDLSKDVLAPWPC